MIFEGKEMFLVLFVQVMRKLYRLATESVHGQCIAVGFSQQNRVAGIEIMILNKAVLLKNVVFNASHITNPTFNTLISHFLKNLQSYTLCSCFSSSWS